MVIREKYMMLSNQAFSYTTAKYLNRVFTDENKQGSASVRRSSIFPNEASDNVFEKNDGKKQLFLQIQLIPKLITLQLPTTEIQGYLFASFLPFFIFFKFICGF
jgi:hypothetical protein